MTADLFLTCFLACMFAFVVFGVFGWQLGVFMLRRWFAKSMPDLVQQMLHGGTGATHGMGPEERAAMEELMKNAAQTPAGVMPHLALMKCRCGREQSVPLDVPLQPFIKELALAKGVTEDKIVAEVLEEIGWKFSAEKYDGWGCPFCVNPMLDAIRNINQKGA